jgi:hypothetical protein
MDGDLVALSSTARRLHEAANALPPTTRANARPWRGPRTPLRPPWGGCCCPQVVAVAVEEEWEEEEGGLRGSRRRRSSSRRRMLRGLRLGDGDHNNDGYDDNGDGNDPQCRSFWHPTPLPWSLPSLLQSSVRDLVRSALGRMLFFPGIGTALPTTRAIIFITLFYIALLPSHEIKSSSSLIEAEATIRWCSSSDEEYR